MVNEEPGQVTGVVLAAGRARRAGGVNKALVPWPDGDRSVPLFEFAAANLRACCERVFINTERDRAVFEAAGYAVIGDGPFVDHGPLAGIYAGCQATDDEWLAVAPCDQLALPNQVYAKLVQAARRDGAAYAVSGGSLIPTCAVLHTKLVHLVREALMDQRLALVPFMQRHAVPVRFDDVEFANVNDPFGGSANRERPTE
ncbi:MAG: molybdenum cofactor guanylyltransferase [Pseudomonadota bacterium]